jgi:hypothetical protein
MGPVDRNINGTYYDMQKRIPWIIMSSGVNIQGDTAKIYGAGSRLAQNNQLKAIQPGQALPGYQSTESLGIRPQPGILTAKIHSHNRFGSLRTAVVSYVCWSKEQLDILELLYMRPGMTVLLEWGHSVYFTKNKSGQYTTGDVVVPLARPLTPQDKVNFFQEKGIKNIQEEINKKRGTYGYAYDAVYGFIKNFSWSLRPDGGYDCTTSIVSAGDLVESMKINFYISQKEVHARTVEVFNKANQQLQAQNGGRLVTSTASNGNKATYVAYTKKEIAQLKSVDSPSVDQMLNLSAVSPVTFPNTPDGKEGQELYDNYKERVAKVITRIEKNQETNTLYINPVEKTFAFTGTSGGGKDGTVKASGYNYDALVREAKALIAKNPDVEILKLQAGKPAIVLRFKN